MKIGHFQLECATGNIEANAAKIVKCLHEADERKIDIVSFPESFLTGFYSREEDARASALSLEGNEIADLLARTASVNLTWMTGFNELRGAEIFNTVLVARRGRLLGHYSKAFPEPYFSAGREFPVFEHDGVKFGVVICADGGYIEPTRILALKGARIIFSPHFNYIESEHLIHHFQSARSDHIARAVENGVWFLRGNNVVRSSCDSIDYAGVGYGDSYVVSPTGEFVAVGRRHHECLLSADVFLDEEDCPHDRSRVSARALGSLLSEVLSQDLDK